MSSISFEYLNKNPLFIQKLWLSATVRPNEVQESEYEEFYKAITKDSQGPLAHIHFVAEGEVTFKSLLYIPKVQPTESFNKYGTRTDNIKVSHQLLRFWMFCFFS